MPIISTFFGIIIRMFFDDHAPPHFHAEYQGQDALVDFNGTILEAKSLQPLDHIPPLE